MQYSAAAVLALAATASAWATNGTVVYTTEVHTAYTTVCPAATQLTFNGVTYTATASTTLTITNCPCTIVKPVTTSAVVVKPTTAPAAPPAPPVYTNGTTPAAQPHQLPPPRVPSVLPLPQLAQLPPHPPSLLQVPTRPSPCPVPALLVSSVSLLTFCKQFNFLSPIR